MKRECPRRGLRRRKDGQSGRGQGDGGKDGYILWRNVVIGICLTILVLFLLWMLWG